MQYAKVECGSNVVEAHGKVIPRTDGAKLLCFKYTGDGPMETPHGNAKLVSGPKDCDICQGELDQLERLP